METKLPKEISDNKWIKLVMKLIPFLPFLSVLWVRTNIDSDTYWILKTGEYICNNGIPKKDFLTIHSDMDLVVQQWLSDVIYYKAYSAMGVMGVLLVVMAAILIFAALMYNLCNLITGNKVRSALASILVCASMSASFVTRPQVFTYCIILAELICLEKYIKDGKIKHLLILPALSALLVNLHASMWTMLFIMLLPYLANALPIKIKGKSIACCKIMPLIVTAVAMIICGLITPYGIKGLTFLFTTSIGNKVNSSIMELTPVVLSKSSGDIVLFLVPVLITACYILHKGGKTTPRYVLLSIGTGAMMFMYRKLGAYFMIASVPSVLYYLNDIDIISYLEKLSKKEAPKSKKKSNIPLLVTLICILCIGILAYTFIGFGTNVSEFVKNNAANETADEIITAMEQDMADSSITKDDLVIYNGFNIGGYLEFKGYKTYIDARADSFVEEANNDFDYLTEYHNLKSGNVYYKDVFDKYDFDYAIIGTTYEKPLYVQLEHDSDYELICENDELALFKTVK